MKRICLSIVFISVLLIAFFQLININGTYEPALLLPVLNSIFLGALLLITAFFSAKIYTQSNLKSALYMCCGMLIFGAGSTIAGWVRFLPDGTNGFVTIHNISALAASLFHFIAAYGEEDPARVSRFPLKERKKNLALGLVFASVFIVFVTLAAGLSVLPHFIDQNGASVLRQLVLLLAVMFFFSSSILLLKIYHRKRSDYFFWYFASLAMITVGLIAFSLLKSVGSPISWLGRADQYIGGIFAFLAVRAAVKDAKQKGLDLSAAMKDSFTNAEEVYTRLMSMSPHAVISLDEHFRIVLANKSASDLFGYSSSELAELYFFDLLTGNHSDLLRNEFENCKRSRSVDFSGKIPEAQAVRKSGEIFPVEAAYCINKITGRYVCTYIIQKIEGRKIAGDMLAENDLLKTIIEQISDPVYIKDTSGRILLCNWAYANSLGRTVEETIGIDDFEAYEDQKMAKSIFENNQKVMRENEPQIIEETAPSGKIYRSTKTPWKDARGNVLGIICILREITDRRKSEEELIQLKNELSAEVRSLNVLYRVNSNFIIQNDLEKIIRKILGSAVLLTNSKKGSLQLFDEEQKLLTMIAAQGLGDRFLACFYKIDLNTGTGGKTFRERKMVMTSIRGNPLFEGKPALKFLLEEGIQFELSMPLIASSGRFVGVINIYYTSNKKVCERECRMLEMLARIAADKIQEQYMMEVLKKSEEHALALVGELRAVDRNKNEFLNKLSHELRNPLAVVVAGLSLLDMTDDKQKTGPAKEIIRRQIDQLCHLVDDLLDLTRISNNKIVLKKERLELNKLARQTADEHRALFTEKNMQLETILYGKDIYIEADPVRLKQLIGNLLQNAIKFSDEHSKTSIRISEDNQEAVIRIKDNGIGVELQFLPRLFEPFQQAEHSLERTNGGLGLGLAVVKGIVELHGGSVRAESKGPGTGTEFIIHLPIDGSGKKNTASWNS